MHSFASSLHMITWILGLTGSCGVSYFQFQYLESAPKKKKDLLSNKCNSKLCCSPYKTNLADSVFLIYMIIRT